MTPLRAFLAAAACAVLQGVPRIALACSVCSAGREDETQTAFLVTTIFLSVLPLSMFAGFGFWLWRRHRSRQRELEERDGWAITSASFEPPAAGPSPSSGTS